MTKSNIAVTSVNSMVTSQSKKLNSHSVARFMIVLFVSCVCVLAMSFPASAKDKSTDAKKDDKIKNSMYAELAKVPPKDAARHNPLENDPDAVTAGQKIFGLHCAECHGANADGGHKGPSLRADQVQQSTAGSLFWVLTNGEVRKGMPVWSKLPEGQRWQIVSYVKSLIPKPQVKNILPIDPGKMQSTNHGSR